MAADRAQLEAWIAQTQRTQKKLVAGLVPAGIVAFALLFVSRPIGGAACAMVGMFALFGFWITTSHVRDFEGKLDELDKPPPQIVGGRLRRERD
jgi:hypothetical protein